MQGSRTSVTVQACPLVDKQLDHPYLPLANGSKQGSLCISILYIYIRSIGYQ